MTTAVTQFAPTTTVDLPASLPQDVVAVREGDPGQPPRTSHARPEKPWFKIITEAASQFPSPTRLPDASTKPREQVLAAARVRIVREPLGVLSQGLNPSRFDSWMPGLRRKAYRYFPSTSELVQEVLLTATDPERSEATDQLVGAMGCAAANAVCPLEAVRALPTAYVERICSDDIFRLELTGWLVMHDHCDVRSQLNALHDSLVERSAAGLEILLTSYGLELRAPVTWTELATMLLALVRGTALSAEVKGDDYDPEVIIHALMGMMVGLTQPIGGSADLQATFLSHFEAGKSSQQGAGP